MPNTQADGPVCRIACEHFVREADRMLAAGHNPNLALFRDLVRLQVDRDIPQVGFLLAVVYGVMAACVDDREGFGAFSHFLLSRPQAAALLEAAWADRN